MRLWRISNFTDLDGHGGLLAPGRWHSAGQPVVYCAESPAGALLEVLVHAEIRLPALPLAYRLIRIHAPDDAKLQSVEAPPGGADTPAAWRDSLSWSRGEGDAWLASRASPLLRVPSAIVPHTWNVIINPLHPDATRIAVEETFLASHDSRLFELRGKPVEYATDLFAA